jgi:ribokinase
MPAKVVVIGSLNMDLVTRAPRLPRGGETLIGQSFATVSGRGRGAAGSAGVDGRLCRQRRLW